MGRGSYMSIVASFVLMLCCAWAANAFAQAPGAGFPNVVDAVKAAPGCLGVETAQTASGKRVIFAWFESKKGSSAGITATFTSAR